MKKTSKRTSTSRKRSAVPPLGKASAVLADLATVVDERRYRWYLFGAQAVALHGVPRTTADVDVTVDYPVTATHGLLRDLEVAGFTPAMPFAGDFATKSHVLPLVHGATQMAVDLVRAGPGLEQLVFERVQERVIDGVRVPVVSREDLIVLKILAGRPKDLEDVRRLVGLDRAALDAALIRQTLGSLEEALGQSDLIPVFEALLRR